MRCLYFVSVQSVFAFVGQTLTAGSPAPLPSPYIRDVATSWLQALPSGGAAHVVGLCTLIQVDP
jgi:hypothetical protein